MKVFTIGYGGRTRDEVVALLRENGAATLADIRLRPDRASMGMWVKARTPDKGIERWLGEAGIGYASLVELGNVFRDLPDWAERYGRLLEAAGDLLTERLRSLPGPICLLCAEKRVEACHRRHVADYLARYHGAQVHHLE